MIFAGSMRVGAERRQSVWADIGSQLDGCGAGSLWKMSCLCFYFLIEIGNKAISQEC